MKKFLTVVLAVLALVSMFAAEKPFTLGPNVSYTADVYFELAVTKDGIDIYGDLLNIDASLSYAPTADTQAGASFSISYTPFDVVTLKLKSITFNTPYFGAYYSVSKMFVSDYFTGKDYNASGAPFKDPFKTDFADSLKLTFPAVAGLELYYLDKVTEGTATWFSDMVLVKYPVAGFELVGGAYNTGDTNTHEFGGAVKGTLDLGFFKPSLTVFGGMVEGTSGMETAYDFILTGSIAPVTGLTITPTVKFAENLAKLDYKSSNIVDRKYVQAVVKYSQTFGTVTPTVQVTPKYDIAASKFTLALNEASVKAVFTPVTVFVKTTNADLLDSSKKYTLYVQGDFVAEMFSLTAKASWNDVTAFDNYEYIHVNASATVDALTLAGNFRMTKTDNGYNVSASYALTSNVKLTGFFGTLTGNDTDGWTFLTEPTWNAKLIYSASF